MNLSSGRAGFVAVLAITILAGLLIVGFLPRLHRQAELADAIKGAQASDAEVRVAPVRRAQAASDLVLPGSIEAVHEAPIYSRTNGYVHELKIDIGDRVKAGQLLAQIETPEVDQELIQARANLEQAHAALELAHATMIRFQDLEQKGVVSSQDRDEKDWTFRARQATVAASEASVRRLEEMQSFQKVTAPFAGIITVRNVDIGALVTAGSNVLTNRELFRIARIDTLRIFVNVPQSFVSLIRIGEDAQITGQDFPKTEFTGKVSRTANALDPQSRTLRTEIRLDNHEYALLPGMYARVRFILSRTDAPLIVPAPAILVRADGMYVARIQEKTVHLTKVQVGRDHGREVEIISGLSAEDIIVTNPKADLKDGSTVRIIQ